ncbi:MAG: DUF3301 domain-containing protein [Pseudomonadota bacterium]|nr:DUF3301 domain-containing protein [Pseudomonadota bacterium]
MSDLSNLLLLLVLVAVVGLWLKLSVARERATHEARRLCQQHELQLLDESVGLRRLRLRRVNGLRRIERCYAFDVSIDGKDRQPGRLWMIDTTVTSVSLPATGTTAAEPIATTVPLARITGNVVPLRPRDDRRLH